MGPSAPSQRALLLTPSGVWVPASSGGLEDFARFLSASFICGASQTSEHLVLSFTEGTWVRRESWRLKSQLTFALEAQCDYKCWLRSAESILSLVPPMQMQMRESAELTGPTILGQPALLSAVPGVRPFLFIGKFFQTTSVTSFDSDHANPLLRLFLADHIPPVHDVTAPAHISAIFAVTCSYLSCVALGFHASAESGFQLHLT